MGLAYRLKEDFFKIYDAGSRHEALARFAEWDRSVTHEFRDAFSDLTRAWRYWQPYILNYFDAPNINLLDGEEVASGHHPVTNAYTESLNSLIRVMNRLGRGYSFEALRAKILFAEGAFKKQIIRPKFERWPQQYEPGYAGFAMADMSFDQPDQAETEINYGVDISTLVEMIENGQI